MPTIWRPKPFKKLTKQQIAEKIRKDKKYEQTHAQLTADYKAGKITREEFEKLHQQQWNEYVKWAKSYGIYEEITPEQQLIEAEAALNDMVEKVNELRKELNKPTIQIKEVVFK